MKFNHIAVMPNECIEGLNLKNNGIYFDGTLGGGGHSSLILANSGNSRLIATDLDIQAIHAATIRLKKFEGRFTLIHDNFKNFKMIINGLAIDGIDGALLDLGVSSYQLDERARGFSYMADSEKLDMRMNKEQSLSAFEVVNSYSEKSLIKILKEYGEEKFAGRIASNIIQARKNAGITTCGELVGIIDRSVPKAGRDGHPAKQTFQAIRIEVNGELSGLSEVIFDIVNGLKTGGRLAVITFHSLEDRIVKNALRNLESDCVCDKSLPICICGKRKEIKLITKKPVIADEKEVKANPRAKSAKLRICEKI